MKARRDFLDEAEYADYLKTYATIAAMQGLLANGNIVYSFGESAKRLIPEYSDSVANAMMKKLYEVK